MEKPNDLEGAKNLMTSFVRMKPKPHEDTKVGKTAKKYVKRKAKKK